MTAGTRVRVTIDITSEKTRDGVVVKVGKHTMIVRYDDGEIDVINRLNARKIMAD